MAAAAVSRPTPRCPRSIRWNGCRNLQPWVAYDSPAGLAPRVCSASPIELRVLRMRAGALDYRRACRSRRGCSNSQPPRMLGIITSFTRSSRQSTLLSLTTYYRLFHRRQWSQER